MLGMRNGVQGALQGRLVDLSGLDDAGLERLKRTPSAALGSCRYKLRAGDAERIVTLCKDEGVDAFVYIGGNDSADTSRQIAQAAEAADLELRVVGVPKTVDNDLPATDHCPGYGSAARFVAQITRETALDTVAMRTTDPIRLIEVMGRDAGWLAGAAWLAKERPEDAPHLVYVPERPQPIERIVADVREVYASLGWCVVVLCENQPTPDGRIIGAVGEPRWLDAFGHAYFDSPAQALAQRLQAELRVRVRFDKPGTIQRMATAYVSTTDRAEAEQVGRAAVTLATAGTSGVMVTLERQAGPGYSVRTGTTPLEIVANQQKRLPDEFIAPSGTGMTDAFVAYATPLIGEPLPNSSAYHHRPHDHALTRRLRAGLAGAEGFGGVGGGGGQAFLFLEGGELAIDFALLLQELEAVVHGVSVELAQGSGARFLLVHLLFDAVETGQRAVLIEARERGADRRLSLRPATARNEQLLFGLRILHLRLELAQRFLELLDLGRLLVVLGLEAVGGLLERVAASQGFARQVVLALLDG